MYTYMQAQGNAATMLYDWAHTHTHIYVCMYTHTHTHQNTHLHIHIHTCMHVYIYAGSRQRSHNVVWLGTNRHRSVWDASAIQVSDATAVSRVATTVSSDATAVSSEATAVSSDATGALYRHHVYTICVCMWTRHTYACIHVYSCVYKSLQM